MALNQTIRGRFGATITEATILTERNAVFRQRVTGCLFDQVDNDEPAESPVPRWNDPGNKLDRALLWELVGSAGSQLGTDEELRDHLLRELGNRERIWDLMQAAVAATQAGSGPTEFMLRPLQAAQNAGCLKVDQKTPIDLNDLMIILHMFGKPTVIDAPRPVHPITAAEFFYTTEDEVAAEIQRRVRELVAGITWEGNVTGGRERKKLVWNRRGFYCGCG